MNKKIIGKDKLYSSLDDHPQKEQIIKDILAQKPYNTIKKTYSINSVNIIRTFVTNRLLYPAAKANVDAKQDTQSAIMNKLDEIQGYLNKLIHACNEWLTDPQDKDRYFIGDRADEISVVWLENSGSKIIRKKDSLQNLIDMVIDPDRQMLQYVQTNRTDTRKIMLDTLRLAQQQVELIAKITGEMHEISMSVDVYGVVLPHVISVINQCTEGRPDLQRKLYEGLAEISDLHDAQTKQGY